ncbi:MAG TPA: MmcQ/YjbR family DNA-binding protein [Thermoanaerobaculia bacterium]|nr:MmcQ/YjbR family DNA-binding protein [Thermoanaerobaculia bacterium]
MRVADIRRMLLELPDVVEGRSYGMPSFLVHGNFLARFRDDDTVLALRIASIDDRDVLMQLDPDAFFFTDHYKDYPAVLIRLADVPEKLLRDVLKAAHKHVASQKPKRKKK